MSSASISFPMLGDWSINPSNYFVLFGHTFYWYGVIIAFGFLLAVAYCFCRCRQFGISQDQLTDNLLFAVPIGIIGARTYYVLFNLDNYNTFWDACKIWEGGLAIYGGVIAAVITVLVVCRVKRISSLAVLDTVSFGLLIGQSVGRWGNFMNREAYGYETSIFCRMGLTLNGETIYVHPTFLYESLWNAIGFVILHIISKKTKRKFDGQFFLYYLAWYGLGRSWIEGLRTDSLYIGNSGIRVSQLLAMVTFLGAVLILVIMLRSGRCKPERLWVNRVALAEGNVPEKDGEAADGDKAGETPKGKNVVQLLEESVFGSPDEKVQVTSEEDDFWPFKDQGQLIDAMDNNFLSVEENEHYVQEDSFSDLEDEGKKQEENGAPPVRKNVIEALEESVFGSPDEEEAVSHEEKKEEL